MKKIIFGLIAVIAIVSIVFAFPQHEDKSGNRWGDYILSDKDIYYNVDSLLPHDGRDLKVVDELVDIANGYAILGAGFCDAECWLCIGEVVNDYIRELKTGVIKDKQIRKAAEEYKKILLEVLPKDTSMWCVDTVLCAKVKRASIAFGDKILEKSPLAKYKEITNESVLEHLDKMQFVSNYDSVHNLRSDVSEDHARYMKLMAEQTPNFDRKCIYAIEFAHQTQDSEALNLLEECMKEGKYSRFLPELWATWRCMVQMETSPSVTGFIDNLRYNKMRYRCLNAIVKRIIENPKDIFAINHFCFLATYDNIVRIAPYHYGNSANVEYYNIFYLLDLLE